MNIGEANDTNTLLRYLLGVSAGHSDLPSDEHALAAITRLAARANTALGAGLTPELIAAAWPGVQVGPPQVGLEASGR